MAELKGKRITSKDAEKIMAPMELDLIAAFSQMQDDINKLVRQAVRENWLPDKLISAIGELI